MLRFTFGHIEGKLKRNPEFENFISLLDVKEERANPNNVAVDQRVRFVEGNGPAIECGRARCAEIDEVKIVFDLTNACM